MSEVLRRRIISPDTRKSISDYRVSTKGVGKYDTLRVEISHTKKSQVWVYKFTGVEIGDRDSIYFSAKEVGGDTVILWRSLKKTLVNGKTSTRIKSLPQKTAFKGNLRKAPGGKYETSPKKSFPPIIDKQTEVLILGTLPGDESLRLQQYYANPRNQFWKILEGVWGEICPTIYKEKVQWLLKHKVGLWDVCHSAERKGSLDHKIVKEVPNNLEKLLKENSRVAIILFNGVKACTVFDKYNKEASHIQYVSVPSSSSASAKPLTEKIGKWKRALKNIQEVGNE